MIVVIILLCIVIGVYYLCSKSMKKKNYWFYSRLKGVGDVPEHNTLQRGSRRYLKMMYDSWIKPIITTRIFANPKSLETLYVHKNNILTVPIQDLLRSTKPDLYDIDKQEISTAYYYGNSIGYDNTSKQKVKKMARNIYSFCDGVVILGLF